MTEPTKDQTEAKAKAAAKAAAAVSEMENDPNLFQAVLEKIDSSPMLKRIKDTNVKYSKYGAKAKLGEILASRLESNVLRKMMPVQYHGALDFPLVRPGINLLAGNGLLVAGVTFQERVPEKIAPFMTMPGEALIAYAWNNGFASVDVEGFFTGLFDGEVMGLCKKAAEEDAKK